MTTLVDSDSILRTLFEGRIALMLEDVPDFGEPVRRALLNAGFQEVVLVSTGDQALALAMCQRFDVLLLDRNNPGLDGLEVLRRVRAAGDPERTSRDAVALVISMYGSDEDRLEGLMAGANDYIPKRVDFPEREVVLRVASQLMVTPRPAAPARTAEVEEISYGGLRFLLRPRTLFFQSLAIDAGGGKLPLAIIEALIRAKGVPLSHTMLWDSCWVDWRFRPDTYVNVVDTRIKAVRKRLSEQMPDGLRDRHSVIANVWQEGFVIRDNAEWRPDT